MEVNKESKKSRILLMGLLRPLRTMTRFTGILPDWCRQADDDAVPSCFLITLYRLVILILVFSFLITTTAFESYQTFTAVQKEKRMYKMVPHFVWLIPVPHTCWIAFFYLKKRKEMLAFFKAFHVFDMNFVIPSIQIRRTFVIVYLMYILIGLFTLACVSYATLQPPNFRVNATLTTYEPYFPFYYQSLRELFTETFLEIFHITTFLFVVLYQLLSDLVPAFVYYRFGVIIDIIRNEVREILPFLTLPERANKGTKDTQTLDKDTKGLRMYREGRDLHHVWSKYNNLSYFLKKADNLFGSLVLLEYANKFVMICCLFFWVMHNMRVPNFDYTTPLIIIIPYIIRMICCILMKSNLYQSSYNFISEMATWENKYWYKLSSQKRKLLSTFHDQLGQDVLCANPLLLFTITPTLLLSMFSLIVSYMVILLQSR